jgi:phosphoenolpyruvate carboxykinase (GTP)
VLEWVFRRCDDAVEADDTPIGRVPTPGGLDTDGLAIDEADLAELLKVDPAEWQPEIEPIREFYEKFGDKLPDELSAQLDALRERLDRAQS